jgi:hypothetical protein
MGYSQSWLAIRGKSAAAVRDELGVRGTGIHFDIPVQLAESRTGYRHDQDVSGPGDRPFEVLVDASIRPERPSWWKWFFGS